MAFDRNNTSYVAYQDYGNGHKATVKKCGGGGGPSGPLVTLSKSVSPAAAHPGEAVTFTLAFRNYGAVTATNILVTDTLPAGFAVIGIVSAGVRITQTASNPYAWQVQDLKESGGVITLTGTLASSLAPGKLTNVAMLSASGLAQRSAAANLTVLKPQATITLTNLSHT